MADVFDPDKRSDVMSRIRSKNTKPEKLVFAYLRGRGIYFQMHYKRAPGQPDIALPRKKRAVFIHGDFWHGREIERLRVRFADKPYWLAKIERNRQRDKDHLAELNAARWQVLIVWEYDLGARNRREEALRRVEEFLTSRAISSRVLRA
jgi:DNA mismatch endonuclease (patch repair protein)